MKHAVIDLAAAADGEMVRVVGLVRREEGEEALVAPLTGRPCVYYQVVVRTLRRHAVEVTTDAGAVTFRIVDATGAAVIETTNVEWTVEADHEAIVEAGATPDEAQQAFLRRHVEVQARGDELRFFESIVELGAMVSVVGTGEREVDPMPELETPYRGLTPTRMRFRGAEDAPVQIRRDLAEP